MTTKHLRIAAIIAVLLQFGAGGLASAAPPGKSVEIGTLRALGFARRSILIAFLLESILLALAGAAAGLTGASLLQAVRISTTTSPPTPCALTTRPTVNSKGVP